jgi:hypothetical protein
LRNRKVGRYPEFFGIIAVAWQWLVQALVVRKALENLLSPFFRFYQIPVQLINTIQSTTEEGDQEEQDCGW